MLVHILMPKIFSRLEKHKGKVFSLFGGIIAAYVFLDLLPKLEQTRTHFENLFGGMPHFVYLIIAPVLAFIGFVTFFSLEHLAERRSSEQAKDKSDKPAFAVHLGNIIFLNIVIGYLLRFETELGIIALIPYTAILSLHFITLDKSMEEHYGQLYVKIGRYIAGAAPLIGWGLSGLFPEKPSEGYLLLALVVGVVLFNSIKNEMHKGGKSNTKEFLLGTLFSSILLLIVIWLRC
jgi:hypothetical protein